MIPIYAMPKRMYKSDYLARFHPGVYYHVYNRTNNREPLFKDEDDKKVFLSRYRYYLTEYVDLYAWCLMENHFHLLIRVKAEEIILRQIQQSHQEDQIAAHRHFLQSPESNRDFHPVVERQFTRMFTSYSAKFNLKNKRTGNLFHRPFNRVEVFDEDHLVWLVYYIHSNPVKHRVLTDFTTYQWSSYRTILSEKPTLLLRNDVLEWFGGLEKFLEFHIPKSNCPEEVEYLNIER